MRVKHLSSLLSLPFISHHSFPVTHSLCCSSSLEVFLCCLCLSPSLSFSLSASHSVSLAPLIFLSFFALSLLFLLNCFSLLLYSFHHFSSTQKALVPINIIFKLKCKTHCLHAYPFILNQTRPHVSYYKSSIMLTHASMTMFI